MRRPLDIRLNPSHDLADPAVLEWVLAEIAAGGVAWVWLSPPCWSHSVVQNGHKGGQLRSNAFPEGVPPLHPDCVLGNKLWDAALTIFEFAVKSNLFAFVEHPWTAYSWKCARTKSAEQLAGVERIRVDMCNFAECDEKRTLKPTGILTNAPWLKFLTRRCTKDHVHAAHLCGKRAKDAASYSPLFCSSLAAAYAAWSKV